jgi:hypothetical protein
MKLKTVEPAEAISSLETEAKKKRIFLVSPFLKKFFLAKFLKKFFLSSAKGEKIFAHIYVGIDRSLICWVSWAHTP